MANFIHEIVQPLVDVAGDSEVIIDLPVTPLSVVLVNLQPLNDTGTLTNFQLLGTILDALNDLRVSYRGTTLIQGRGQDLGAVARKIWGVSPWVSNAIDTDNDRRSVVLPICLGRRPLDPVECMAATKRGELTLALNFDDADTGYDNLNFGVEAISLPDAQPTHIQRVTTIARTFVATGMNQVDLPVGHLLRSLIMFGTTGFTGASPAPSITDLAFLVNNQQIRYSRATWQTLMGLYKMSMRKDESPLQHIHEANGGAAGFAATTNEQLSLALETAYGALMFDYLGDDLYSVDLSKAARCHLDINVGTADLCRFLPVEQKAIADVLQSGGGSAGT